MWRDRPTFVTGATGFLGGRLVRDLVERGADVICLVRDWPPHSEFVSTGLGDRVTVVRGDVTDQVLIERVLGEYEIATVFHLAAQTIVGVGNRNPVSTFETNIRGTWTILEAIRRSPSVDQVLVASSDKAYGAHDELPYTENASLRGSHPYDVTKSAADLIAQSYASTYDLPVAISRCGNLYGGGDLNWNRIVPGTIRSVLRGNAPVIRSDGLFVRDYIYVDDASSAYIMLAEALAEDKSLSGEAFNFSNETPITVLDLTGQILRLMDSSLKPDIQNEASNEIREQYLSAEKARSILKWEPRFDVETGLKSTVEWYRDFLAN
jgi:CDP-glucose 4,6-dehydratase